MYDVVEIVQFYQPNAHSACAVRTRFILNNFLVGLDWGSQYSPLLRPWNTIQYNTIQYLF